MAIARTPWLGCVTLSDSNIHLLSDLLKALSDTQKPDCLTRSVPRCVYLLIGNDQDNGSAKLYVGNETLTTSFFGAKLFAGQFVPYYNMDSNLIRLDQIYIMGDTNPMTVVINLLTR